MALTCNYRDIEDLNIEKKGDQRKLKLAIAKLLQAPQAVASPVPQPPTPIAVVPDTRGSRRCITRKDGHPGCHKWKTAGHKCTAEESCTSVGKCGHPDLHKADPDVIEEKVSCKRRKMVERKAEKDTKQKAKAGNVHTPLLCCNCNSVVDVSELLQAPRDPDVAAFLDPLVAELELKHPEKYSIQQCGSKGRADATKHAMAQFKDLRSLIKKRKGAIKVINKELVGKNRQTPEIALYVEQRMKELVGEDLKMPSYKEYDKKKHAAVPFDISMGRGSAGSAESDLPTTSTQPTPSTPPSPSTPSPSATPITSPTMYSIDDSPVIQNPNTSATAINIDASIIQHTNTANTAIELEDDDAFLLINIFTTPRAAPSTTVPRRSTRTRTPNNWSTTEDTSMREYWRLNLRDETELTSDEEGDDGIYDSGYNDYTSGEE